MTSDCLTTSNRHTCGDLAKLGASSSFPEFVMAGFLSMIGVNLFRAAEAP